VKKVNQNGETSYPRTRKGFRTALRDWLEKDYSVALDLAFRSKRDPLIKADSFLQWFQPTIKRSREILEEVFINEGVPPGPLLDALAMHLLIQPLYPTKIKNKLRSVTKRETDAIKIEKMAQLLTQWEAVLPSLYLEAPEEMASDYFLPDELRRIAKEIRNLGPGITHRPSEMDRIACAKELVRIFKNHIRRPCYRYVGTLLWNTFSTSEKPPYTFEEYAKRLANTKQEDTLPWPLVNLRV
jgi:hypothetical protein